MDKVRPAEWKRAEPKPGWWETYRDSLCWNVKEVKERLLPRGFVLLDKESDGRGWWESPTEWAHVTVSKGIWHISDFPKRSAVPVAERSFGPAPEVIKDIYIGKQPAKSWKQVNPKQGSLF